ncbi:GNAT family N-acetyltransferase [Microlunatus speluncae]|uniref:GNAT family N-acetyltransferase n=1 Tax=Microlunatus speluncae TaxID=2594267 RepID=UPI0012666E89|nr:N-acetyltransferase [Microlunatus speluncae]
MNRPGPVVRAAELEDVPAVRRFGETQVFAHYAALIDSDTATAQVDSWWNEAYLNAAVAANTLVVAADEGRVIGVGQSGLAGADHVIYKLYVHADHRGHGLGPRLIDALIQQLPADVIRLYVEQFVANERAGAFYQREGFTVQRIEPSSSGDPALAQVWRVRRLKDGRTAGC